MFEHMGREVTKIIQGTGSKESAKTSLVAPDRVATWAQLYVLQRKTPTEFLQMLDETRAMEYLPFLTEALDRLETQASNARFVFRINQLREMLNRGLEKEICKAKGIPFIEDISRAA